MKRCLIIFAKEPEIGKVKTRLSSELPQAQCLRLYRKFLRYTIELARNINCSDRIIAYDAYNKEPNYLKKIASDFQFYRQKGNNLGERMFNAFMAVASDNVKIIIMGSDSPGLPKSCINKAFSELSRNDLALGPTYDGGYYLIGMKKPCREIFKGIKWSSSTVFENTLKKAKRLGKKVVVLGPWYDIDRPEDLKYLRKREV